MGILRSSQRAISGIVLALFVAFHPISSYAEQRGGAPGVFVIIPLGIDVASFKLLEQVQGTAGVSGFTLLGQWDAMEPVEGRYDWVAFDRALEAVKKSGHKLILGMLPGISTPNWVYAKGARRFTFKDENPWHSEQHYPAGHRFSTFGKTLSIPVPWDVAFIEEWEQFVEAFGARYQNLDNLAMVIVTGPNSHSSEMHLPKTLADRKQWRTLGYSTKKLIGVWQRSIDAFARAFPKTPLVIHLSPVIYEDEVLAAVARYGYQTYGQRFFMQNDILLADNKGMSRPDWKLLRDYAPLTTIGFQRGLPRIAGWEKMSRLKRLELRREAMAGMFEHGLSLGAKFFEIGMPDAVAFPEVVEEAARNLSGSLNGARREENTQTSSKEK